MCKKTSNFIRDCAKNEIISTNSLFNLFIKILLQINFITCLITNPFEKPSFKILSSCFESQFEEKRSELLIKISPIPESHHENGCKKILNFFSKIIQQADANEIFYVITLKIKETITDISNEKNYAIMNFIEQLIEYLINYKSECFLETEYFVIKHQKINRAEKSNSKQEESQTNVEFLQKYLESLLLGKNYQDNLFFFFQKNLTSLKKSSLLKEGVLFNPTMILNNLDKKFFLYIQNYEKLLKANSFDLTIPDAQSYLHQPDITSESQELFSGRKFLNYIKQFDIPAHTSGIKISQKYYSRKYKCIKKSNLYRYGSKSAFNRFSYTSQFYFFKKYEDNSESILKTYILTTITNKELKIILYKFKIEKDAVVARIIVSDNLCSVKTDDYGVVNKEFVVLIHEIDEYDDNHKKIQFYMKTISMPEYSNSNRFRKDIRIYDVIQAGLLLSRNNKFSFFTETSTQNSIVKQKCEGNHLNILDFNFNLFIEAYAKKIVDLLNLDLYKVDLGNNLFDFKTSIGHLNLSSYCQDTKIFKELYQFSSKNIKGLLIYESLTELYDGKTYFFSDIPNDTKMITFDKHENELVYYFQHFYSQILSKKLDKKNMERFPKTLENILEIYFDMGYSNIFLIKKQDDEPIEIFFVKKINIPPFCNTDSKDQSFLDFYTYLLNSIKNSINKCPRTNSIYERIFEILHYYSDYEPIYSIFLDDLSSPSNIFLYSFSIELEKNVLELTQGYFDILDKDKKSLYNEKFKEVLKMFVSDGFKNSGKDIGDNSLLSQFIEGCFKYECENGYFHLLTSEKKILEAKTGVVRLEDHILNTVVTDILTKLEEKARSLLGKRCIITIEKVQISNNF